ncbi:nicotinate-nucleotide adenylyltransferase [Natranaerobius thermophilus]|uniref:Probable nicotinate-nucleotide adenylyltransferase n=1 Tax=Natranaerobius thermophilus (strain ATCC BAA-1301 / DSM 18059 / JW/NM-WN-LF) TaxID=457570 RepID=B2A6B8_NATTJ|nr:nicotinate-nucleotide adenylyltransferase [Natranaerobius thermophilus]ACB84129.1 nicotinate (nicotinamide) nucleotide adenylyltransferase [Natranaerobius thermophilus JW/NM-WN-LF]
MENNTFNASRIAIMGGTFDPIHLGHLMVAEEARQKFSLDKVIFVPVGIPPHKSAENITPSYHRYMMTLLATNNHPHFFVSNFEIDRNQPSYSIETLRYFRDLYDSETSLYFITGTDTILDILTWKDYHELPQLCDFICATRPNFSVEELETRVYRYFPELKPHVHYLQIPLIEISSTEIRNKRFNEQDITFMVPETVENYILKENLFKGD